MKLLCVCGMVVATFAAQWAASQTRVQGAAQLAECCRVLLRTTLETRRMSSDPVVSGDLGTMYFTEDAIPAGTVLRQVSLGHGTAEHVAPLSFRDAETGEELRGGEYGLCALPGDPQRLLVALDDGHCANRAWIFDLASLQATEVAVGMAPGYSKLAQASGTGASIFLSIEFPASFSRGNRWAAAVLSASVAGLEAKIGDETFVGIFSLSNGRRESIIALPVQEVTEIRDFGDGVQVPRHFFAGSQATLQWTDDDALVIQTEPRVGGARRAFARTSAGSWSELREVPAARKAAIVPAIKRQEATYLLLGENELGRSLIVEPALVFGPGLGQVWLASQGSRAVAIRVTVEPGHSKLDIVVLEVAGKGTAIQ